MAPTSDRIPRAPVHANDAALSPDGTRIAFHANVVGGIYVQNIDGSGLRRIADAGWDPAFSPDGTEVIHSTSSLAGTPGVRIAKADGSGNRQVVVMDGGLAPMFLPDGKQIAFIGPAYCVRRSVCTPARFGQSVIYVANADGTQPRPVTPVSWPTLSSTGQLERTRPSYDVEWSRFAISPDGSQIAFWAYYYATSSSGPERRLFRINTDGTQVTTLGTQTSLPRTHAGEGVTWHPDGHTLALARTGELMGMGPDGSAFRTLFAVSSQWGPSAPSFRQAGTAIRSWDQIAGEMRPILRFDSSEHWRPVDIDALFAERNADGSARHRACDGSLSACSDVTAASDLRLHPADDAFLDFSGEGQEQHYKSSQPECAEGDVWECEEPPHARVYFHVLPSTVNGYRFINYWWFYRYNDDPSNPITGGCCTHEGDWEGVALAVHPERTRTFDYAVFTQHGHLYRYLRSTLTCDDGDIGSCGSDIDDFGRRVHVFPANRSHANYPDACSQNIPTDCARPEYPWYEGGHDGERGWAANDNPESLTAFPWPEPWTSPTPRNWTNWPGTWGVPAGTQSLGANGPESPANQEAFNNPAEHECRTEPCDVTSASAARGAGAADAGAADCDSWFGGSVAALVCAPAGLRSTVEAAAFHRDGDFAIRSASGRSAGAVPGLSQLVGRPLSRGERVVIEGDVPRHAKALVRIAHRDRVATASVELPRGSRRTTIRLANVGTRHATLTIRGVDGGSTTEQVDLGDIRAESGP